MAPNPVAGALDLEDLVSLLDHTEELMQSVGPGGELLWANRAWRQALGYSLEEVTGLRVEDFVAPESLGHCQEVFGRLMRGEEVPRIETLFQTRDGVRVRIEGSVQARLVDGACVATFGIFRRLDDQDRRDRVLRHFFDLSLDLLAVASLDGFFRMLNPAWTTSLGYELEELVGRPFVEFVHPGDRDRTIGALGALGEGRTVVGFENRYRHRDGSYRSILWTAAPDPNPSSDQVYAAARDVSDLRAAQAAVEEREARQRALLEAAVDGIVALDSRGVLGSANPAAARILGCEVPDLVGGDLGEALLEPHRSELSGTLATLRDGGGREQLGRTRRLEGVRADGVRIPLEWTLSEVPGDRRYPWMVTFRDISERLEVERLKSEFVSTVSHELRTPLTSIRGTLRLLEQGAVGELPPEAQKLTRVAHANCLRLASLIDDMLDLEKLEAGAMRLDPQEVDLAAVIAESVDRLVGFASEHEVLLLRPEAAPTRVVCDPDRIEQVLGNLLSNAIKFSPAGGEVRTRLANTARGVRVEVEDQGPGVQEQDRERIFRRFQQGDATDRRQRGGTGLGLAICRALVEAHGGEVGVDAGAHGGSVFWFEVPHPEA